MTDKCSGCRGFGRGLGIHKPHFHDCLERIMVDMLKGVDPQDIIIVAAERVTRDEEVGGSPLESEIQTLQDETFGESKTKGHGKWGTYVNQARNARQVEAMQEIKMCAQLSKLMSKQYGNMMRYNGWISRRLRSSLQRARCAVAPLQQELFQMIAEQFGGDDVPEVYSPPRAANIAKQFGSAEGCSQGETWTCLKKR